MEEIPAFVQSTEYYKAAQRDNFTLDLLHVSIDIGAVTCDFQQCGILTYVDSGEPGQPHVKLRDAI